MSFHAARLATEKAVFRPALPMCFRPGFTEKQMKHGAIETEYAGHLFRSRLEARWAVFFNEAGIDWRYETQGFEVDGAKYLPDFYLPTSGTWVEVKGDPDGLSKDFNRMSKILGPKSPLPGFLGSYGKRGTGLLLLGELPSDLGFSGHPMLCRDDDQLRRSWAFFIALKNGGISLVVDHTGSLISTLAGFSFEIAVDQSEDDDGWIVRTFDAQPLRSWPSVCAAYKAARQARFEYGQSGARN